MRIASDTSSSPVCPFCKRPVDLAGRATGKIGCSGCRNIFYYDAATGVLTPLAPGKTSIKAKKVFSQKAQGRVKPLTLIAALMGLLVLSFFLWQERPWESKTSPISEPEALVDEVSRHLKSLAE